MPSIVRDRPETILNFASSIDGKIYPAPGRTAGHFVMSKNEEDFRRMKLIRARVDAILVGAGNIRADNPGLILSAEERARRRHGDSEGRGSEPLRILLTTRGIGIFPQMKIFDHSIGGPTVVVHPRASRNEVQPALCSVARFIELGDSHVPLGDLLRELSLNWGVSTLLCEGGGHLASQFFAERAVDELYLTLTPRILGGLHAPTMVEGAGFFPHDIPAATLSACERIGDELFLHYTFAWASADPESVAPGSDGSPCVDHSRGATDPDTSQ